MQASPQLAGGPTATVFHFDAQRRSYGLGFLGSPACTVLALPLTGGSVTARVSSSGRAGLTLCLPPSLPIGATVVMQALNFPDPGAPGWISVSNGTEIVIQP
jgi:hypothetical protein